MKIYNKKGFYIGLFWLVMAIADLYMFASRGMAFIDALACFCSLFAGVYYITRSLSRNMSAEDTDELSEHIILKARSKAFAWSKGLCLFLIVFYAMIYSHSKNEIHAVLFVGCTLMLLAMIIIEAITEFYYNYKMDK